MSRRQNPKKGSQSNSDGEETFDHITKNLEELKKKLDGENPNLVEIDKEITKYQAFFKKTKEDMHSNLDAALARGENIEKLDEKAACLEDNSQLFQNNPTLDEKSDEENSDSSETDQEFDELLKALENRVAKINGDSDAAIERGENIKTLEKKSESLVNNASAFTKSITLNTTPKWFLGLSDRSCVRCESSPCCCNKIDEQTPNNADSILTPTKR